MTAIPGSVRVGGFIAPSDSTDTYATQDEEYGRGGYRSVADETERLAIPAPRRKAGMMVKQRDTGLLYTLDNDLTGWTEFQGGGGAGVLTWETGINLTDWMADKDLSVPQIVFVSPGSHIINAGNHDPFVENIYFRGKEDLTSQIIVEDGAVFATNTMPHFYKNCNVSFQCMTSPTYFDGNFTWYVGQNCYIVNDGMYGITVDGGSAFTVVTYSTIDGGGNPFFNIIGGSSLNVKLIGPASQIVPGCLAGAIGSDMTIYFTADTKQDMYVVDYDLWLGNEISFMPDAYSSNIRFDGSSVGMLAIDVQSAIRELANSRGGVAVWDSGIDTYPDFLAKNFNGGVPENYTIVMLKGTGHTITGNTSGTKNLFFASAVPTTLYVGDGATVNAPINLFQNVTLLSQCTTPYFTYTGPLGFDMYIGENCLMNIEDSTYGMKLLTSSPGDHPWIDVTLNGGRIIGIGEMITASNRCNFFVKVKNSSIFETNGIYGLINVQVSYDDTSSVEGAWQNHTGQHQVSMMSFASREMYDPDYAQELVATNNQDAIDELALRRQRIDYGRVYLLQAGSEVQDNMFYFPSRKQHNQKNIYLPSQDNLDPTYFNCLWDITEFGTQEITRVHRGLRFQDINAFRTWCLNNLEMNPATTQCAWNIMADVYDVVDTKIPEMKNLGMANAFFNTYRGRHAGNKGVPNIPEYGTGNLYLSEPEYGQFLQNCVRNMIPGMGTYTYSTSDGMNNIFRFPKARKNFYNLLSDEAQIGTYQGPVWTIKNGALVLEINGPFEILHSQSYYVGRPVSGGVSYNYIPKTDFYQAQGEAKAGDRSMVIVYLLHKNDGVDDHYTLFIKPVGIDTIYASGYDDVKYDCYALIERTGGQPRLIQLPMQVSGQGMRWKARVMKPDFVYTIGQTAGTRPKSKQPKKQMRLFLRDINTGKVGPLSSQKIKFLTGRDRPLMPFVVN